MTDEQFDDALIALVAETDREWRRTRSTPPDEVYHYTNAAGFKGILESERLWATITSEVNDLTELAHAADALRATLNRHLAGAALPEYSVLYPPQVTAFEYERSDMSSVFIASLSAVEDDLTQWSMYADAFSGLALGFSSAHLLTLDTSTDTSQAIGFFEVEYVREKQEEFWEWFVSRWEREAAAGMVRGLARAADPLWYAASWFGNLAMAALTILPRMKSSHFRAEHEWRLAHVHFPDHTECAVHSASGYKTHVELDLTQLANRLPLTSVWLGPAVANDESLQLVQARLRDHGYGDVPVKESRIPLRGEPKTIAL